MSKTREIKRFPKKEAPMFTETREKMNKATRLYVVDKLDVPEIANELGVSDKTIYLYLRVKGVIMRPQKRDNRGKFTS